jgi:hypothetical protein
MRDRAHAALVTVRRLCFRLTSTGMTHPEIAERIDVSLRALLSYKAGVKVPHVVVEALESLVMKAEKRVGE